MATRATDTLPTRMRIDVHGAVQGVGFRPFVHARAKTFELTGWAANCAHGLTIEVEGDATCIAELIGQLERDAPRHARVTRVESRCVAPQGDRAFEIRPSRIRGAVTAQVLPDLATCDACLEELRDPTDRRYAYPFINCTSCGPRYTIIERLPYDRARTSMKHFAMCANCRAEYENPDDRRFHAEPIACPRCGPRLALHDGAARALAADAAALEAAIALVQAGQIIAVKGLGGFHLLADARDGRVVERLRALKQRPEKPFAVMFPDLDALERCCTLTQTEAALVSGAVRPIVLLERSRDESIADAVAPGQPRLGALLPYSPLHHLIMDGLGFPVVATSGNRGGEPIATSAEDAFERLAGIADAFLVHDRPIVRPVDDSIVRSVRGRELVLRCARGIAPLRIDLPAASRGLASLGGHLKSSIALSHDDSVVLSQHIGDLDTIQARDAHAHALGDLARLHGLAPTALACDGHPDYATSRAAANQGMPVHRVQHHVAHVAACVAEHAIELPVLGVAWDGSGYGGDGTIWGGEFIVLSNDGWRRLANLRTFRLPGGEAAVREPRRAALGLLFEAFGHSAFAMRELAPVASFARSELNILHSMLARGINAPTTSSAGRLFDAFAAVAGLRQRSSYEGQAAAELEGAVDARHAHRGYLFELHTRHDGEPSWVVDWQPALEAALADLQGGPAAVANGLHAGLARAIAEVAQRANLPRVVLTGGCFQSARLTEAAVEQLEAAGFVPYWHRRVPPNDGGLALGQAAWALREIRNLENAPCA